MRLAPHIQRWAEFHPIAVRVLMAIGLLIWWIVPAVINSYIDKVVTNYDNQNTTQIQINR
jgi:hypothetical protein